MADQTFPHNEHSPPVVRTLPREGRKHSRVFWRRPGMFASKIENQTATAFAREVVSRNDAVSADFAPELPNGGVSS